MPAQETHQAALGKAQLFFAVMKEVRNWPTYFEDYFGLAHAPLAEYKLRRGVTVRLRSNTDDRQIFNDVWLRQVYCKAEDLGKGDLVIDIGAHIGTFSLFAASRGAKVLAFEPFPDNYALLVRNITSNGMQDQILPFNLAVWESREGIDLHRSQGGTGSHSVFGGSPDSIAVPCTTLADVFREQRVERCRLLKIDAEGAEYPILYTAPDEVLSRIESISLEWHDPEQKAHPEYQHEKLKAFLEGRGFEVDSPQALFVYKAVMRGAASLRAKS